jgi:hypothetical protein
VLTVVANVPIESDVSPFTLWALELATLCAANLTDYGLESATDGAATTGGQEYGFDGTVRCCAADSFQSFCQGLHLPIFYH